MKPDDIHDWATAMREKWSSRQTIRLHAGECTASETRLSAAIARIAIDEAESFMRVERACWEAEAARLGEASTWQRSAMDETIRQIHASVGSTETEDALGDDAIIAHIDGMPARMESDFDAARLGRWLGWAQGVACAKGWLTLEGCKLINKQASATLSKPNAVSGETE